MLLASETKGGKVSDTFIDCRLGVTVSRKVGNAVVRNSVKRRIREWFRGSRAEFCTPVDLVVIARQKAQGLSTAETFNALDELVLKLGVRR